MFDNTNVQLHRDDIYKIPVPFFKSKSYADKGRHPFNEKYLLLPTKSSLKRKIKISLEQPAPGLAVEPLKCQRW